MEQATEVVEAEFPLGLVREKENPESGQEKAFSVDEQIKQLEEQLTVLENQRTKSAVEELDLDPDVLRLVAKRRAEERFPRVQREIEKHLKQLAFSGETEAFLEPNTPIFNNQTMKWLKESGFKVEMIKLGQGNGYKIAVKW